MKTVGVFVDVGNIFYCIGKRYDGRKLNYSKYLDFIGKDEAIFVARAFGVHLNDEAIKFITCLRHYGWDPKYRKPRPGKRVDWNVGIAMDIVRLVANNKLERVVIGSSSPDLVPLIEWIKEHGCEVYVVACGIPKELKEVADKYIEIPEELLEDPKPVVTE